MMNYTIPDTNAHIAAAAAAAAAAPPMTPEQIAWLIIAFVLVVVLAWMMVAE